MTVLVGRRRSPLALRSLPADRVRDLAAVAIPTALALALCLFDLTARSLWLDEAATATIAAQHGAAFGAALAHDGGNMLGYYGLLHVLIGAFGNGPLVLRLPSAIAATAVVALISLLGLRLFDRRVALLAGVFGAVSLPLVYWGQEARGYMPMIAFVCASFLLLVVAIERPRPGWRLWIGYTVVTLAAMYMGLEAVLIFPAQLVILIWYRGRARWLLSALLVVAIACIPLAVLAVDRGSSQIFWIPAPTGFIRRQVMLTVFSAGLEPQFYSASGDVLRWLTEVTVAGGAVAVLWRLFRRTGRGPAWPPALVLAWLVLPALVAWVVSELGHPMFEARYLLMSLPAVALFLSWLIVGLWRAGRQPGLVGRLRRRVVAARLPVPEAAVRNFPTGMRVLSAGLLLSLLTLRALQVFPAYGVSTEPWRGVTAHVVSASRPGDCVAFYPLDTRMPFHYYLPAGQTPPRPVLPTAPWSRNPSLVEDYMTLSQSQLAALPGHCTRVWLISSHQGRHANTAAGRQHYQRFQALQTALRRNYHSSATTRFGTAKLVWVELFSLKPAHKA